VVKKIREYKKRYTVPIPRGEQYELLGELWSARARITKLEILCADLNLQIQEMIIEQARIENTLKALGRGKL
jgi:hypothetical protein